MDTEITCKNCGSALEIDFPAVQFFSLGGKGENVNKNIQPKQIIGKNLYNLNGVFTVKKENDKILSYAILVDFVMY